MNQICEEILSDTMSLGISQSNTACPRLKTGSAISAYLQAHVPVVLQIVDSSPF